MSIASALLVLAAALPMAPAEHFPLWQDLEAGDSAALVADKLAKSPDFMSVKAKPPKRPGGDAAVVAKPKNGGIDILGLKFAAIPSFKGDQLARVVVGTEPLCSLGMDEKYRALAGALLTKRPQLLYDSHVVTSREMESAIASTLPGLVKTVSTTFGDGHTDAMLIARISRDALPPEAVYQSKLSLALEQILVNQYVTRGEECQGTGHVRIQFMALYATAQDLQSELEAERDARDGEQKAAAGKL